MSFLTLVVSACSCNFTWTSSAWWSLLLDYHSIHHYHYTFLLHKCDFTRHLTGSFTLTMSFNTLTASLTSLLVLDRHIRLWSFIWRFVIILNTHYTIMSCSAALRWKFHFFRKSFTITFSATFLLHWANMSTRDLLLVYVYLVWTPSPCSLLVCSDEVFLAT